MEVTQGDRSMAVKVLLIGIDGATFQVLDPLIENGTMPFLGSFMAEGVRANLRTVVPALTPPAWTSLVTGVGPGRHGIFDFFQKESGQSHTIRFVTSKDVASETIWEMANRHGVRSIALNFPLCFPPPAIDGYVISGWLPWRQLRLGCRPADLYDRIKQLPGFEPRELAMDMAYEEKALEGCSPEEYADWIALHLRREQQWSQILETLLAEDSCELVTVLFDGVDKLQHLFWRFIDPDLAHTVTEPWEVEIQEACLSYFRQLDTILARIIELAGSQATTIIASDHGFGPQVRTFFVNAWLAEQGYLDWVTANLPQSGEFQTLGVGEIARHTTLLDWQKTVAYAPLPSGNGIHILRGDADHPHGVSEVDYEGFRDELIEKLLALRDPLTGEPVVADVKKREEIFSGPHEEQAPDLTLILQDGGLVSILDSDEVVKPRAEPSGTHHPLGVFLAKGPELLQGARLEELSILQVAPLLLHRLELPIPAELKGALPISLFASDHLQEAGEGEAEIFAEEAPATQRAESAEVDLDEESQAILLSQLRALGYIN
jgi:predicted AlkP superfamily phosphohydrolase/phosphomutase